MVSSVACFDSVSVVSHTYGVQRKMISVDNFFFVFLRLFFALLLLYVTKCMLWRLHVAFLIYFQFAVSRASLIF